MSFIVESILNLLESGGQVLWLLLLTTFALWILIFERFTFFRWSLPGIKEQTLQQWNPYSANKDWQSGHVRRQLLSTLQQDLGKNISAIKMLVALCPLLGLLGTVTGMITVFDVMAISGTGNARMMASGISMATIPTMAGMIAALSGLYFGSFLENKMKIEWEVVSEQLTYK